MRPYRILTAIALGALLGASGCSTNTQGDDASPVYLSVDFQLLPLSKDVSSGTFLQLDTVIVTNHIKVPGSSGGAGGFLDVRVDDYVVEWTRVDGGKTASPTEVFPGNHVVPAGGTSTLTNYPFMSPSALLRPPLDQLFPFNGGIDRETGNTVIRQSGKMILRGHTLAGQTATGFGYFQMNFFYGGAVRPAGNARPNALAKPSLALRPLAGGR